MEQAIRTKRRRMIAERFLADLLQVEWSHVHLEAKAIARAMSDRVEESMTDILGDPGTCPHGNPIPGSKNIPDYSNAVRLTEAYGAVKVARIDSRIEASIQVMVALEHCGLIPGTIGEILHTTTDSILVAGSRTDQKIPIDIARNIWVTAIQES